MNLELSKRFEKLEGCFFNNGLVAWHFEGLKNKENIYFIISHSYLLLFLFCGIQAAYISFILPTLKKNYFTLNGPFHASYSNKLFNFVINQENIHLIEVMLIDY